jgi:hypothetical protein
LFLQQCGNAPAARPIDFLRHFFVRPSKLAILDPMTWRLHALVIVEAFGGDEAPGRPKRWLENTARLHRASPFEQAE